MRLYDMLNILPEASLQDVEKEMTDLPFLKEKDISADLLHDKRGKSLLLIRHTYPERISFAALNLVFYDQEGNVFHKEGLRRLSEVPPVSAVPVPLKKEAVEKLGEIKIERGVITEESILYSQELTPEQKETIRTKAEKWLTFAPVIQEETMQFAAVTMTGSIQKGIEIIAALRNGRVEPIAGYTFELYLSYKGAALTEVKKIDIETLQGRSTWITLLFFDPQTITSSLDIVPLSAIEVKINIHENHE